MEDKLGVSGLSQGTAASIHINIFYADFLVSMRVIVLGGLGIPFAGHVCFLKAFSPNCFSMSKGRERYNEVLASDRAKDNHTGGVHFFYNSCIHTMTGKHIKGGLLLVLSK